MPANVSEAYIANLALAKISSRAIASLDDTTVEARWCKRFYPQCRDEILRSHFWNFAMRRASLSELSTAPLSEWAHQYSLPADFIRLYQLNSFSAVERPELFQIEEGNILTNADVARIRYVFQQKDTTKYDPLFVEALADLLASKICKPITGNDGTGFLEIYKTVSLKEARSVDSREERQKIKTATSQSELVCSRFRTDIE
jgi:hypothetical protein